MNQIGGGQLRPSVFWKIAWIGFSVAVIIYTGYLLNDIITEEVQFSYFNHGLNILNSVMLIAVALLYLRLVFNPYNSIKWDSNSLHLQFKKRNDRCTFTRSMIEAIDLQLNDLFIKKKNGEELHFDVSDMYLNYSEINHFRKDFSENYSPEQKNKLPDIDINCSLQKNLPNSLQK